ncbi:WRKY domain [Dillenia turbinata]|uniref:WRKY domain n=1 Tax=Dillenia turbinata TaxID=194707 RepID=A0AAN8UZW3_9MAGN
MGSEKDCDQSNNLMIELTQGRELAKQLRDHLNHTCSSLQSGGFLVERILSSYEKALSMLNFTGVYLGGIQCTISSSESIPSLANSSPRSEDSERNSIRDQPHKIVLKKRKAALRWTEQVRVDPETGGEGPPDDCYSWRKYGQKDILGAKFPRCYYRCTHRNSQGCLAIKQVQKSDEDPLVYEITYRGRHTCMLASNAMQPSEKRQKLCTLQQEVKQSLKVKSEELDDKEQIFPPFTLPQTESYIFSDSLTESSDLIGSFSPPFISSSTSESNLFSLIDFQSLESDHTEILSNPTSVTNSPIGDVDFSLDPIEFDPNFPFDSPDFFV